MQQDACLQLLHLTFLYPYTDPFRKIHRFLDIGSTAAAAAITVGSSV